MNPGQPKPTGVMIVSLAHLIMGVLWIALGLYLVMTAADVSRIPLGGADLAKYLLPAALLVLGIGAGYGATAWGLWNRRDWARAAAITIAAISLVLEISSLIYALQFMAAFALPFSSTLGGGTVLINAAINIAIIYYMLLPQTMAWFQGDAGYGVQGPQFPGQAWGQLGSCVHCGYAGISPEMISCPNCQRDPRYRPEAQPPPKSPPPTSFVPQAPVSGWLVVKSGPGAGSRFDLLDDTLIGRTTECRIRLDEDGSVSRLHARIRYESGQYYIYDVGSSLGTFVNDRKVQKLMLYDGVTIRLGQTLLEFKKTAGVR